MNSMKQLELNFDKELPVSRAELLKAIKVLTEATSHYDWEVDNASIEYTKSLMFNLNRAKDNLNDLLDKLYDTPKK